MFIIHFSQLLLARNHTNQAFERGVKLIGATAHYVTATLDEGPIIEQDVVRVSHRDTVEHMLRRGRDLEKILLARGPLAFGESRPGVSKQDCCVQVALERALISSPGAVAPTAAASNVKDSIPLKPPAFQPYPTAGEKRFF